jgi:hypothetical protein
MRPLCTILLLVSATACINYNRSERRFQCDSGCTIEVRNTAAVPVELLSGNVSIGTLAPHELRQYDRESFHQPLSGVRMESGDSFVTRSCKARWVTGTLLHFDCPMLSR